MYDKLMVLPSENSVTKRMGGKGSRNRIRKGAKIELALFPIRLDDAVIGLLVQHQWAMAIGQMRR